MLGHSSARSTAPACTRMLRLKTISVIVHMEKSRSLGPNGSQRARLRLRRRESMTPSPHSCRGEQPRKRHPLQSISFQRAPCPAKLQSRLRREVSWCSQLNASSLTSRIHTCTNTNSLAPVAWPRTDAIFAVKKQTETSRGRCGAHNKATSPTLALRTASRHYLNPQRPLHGRSVLTQHAHTTRMPR